MTEMTPKCQECGKELRSWGEPHDWMACLQEKLTNAQARIEALEKATLDALSEVTLISMAVDAVMADWANEKAAELVPTTIGQWAERAAEHLRAALAAEEEING